jgi:hypothetical protein
VPLPLVPSGPGAPTSTHGQHCNLDQLDRKGLIAVPAVVAHIADKLLERDEVINTWPLDRLRRFLAKGRAAPRAGAVKE